MPKKILCTLGPSTLEPQIIKRLDHLKVDMFRLNLSHTPVEQLDDLIDLIRTHSDVPICLDTQGAQARTGAFLDGAVDLKPGAVVDLVAAPETGNADRLPLYPASVVPQLEMNTLISLDFDTALLQVLETGAVCRARVISGGRVGSNKAVSLVDRPLSLPALTSVDRAAIEIGSRLGVPWIALSFANKPDDVELLRELVGSGTQIIAKIESRAGVENLGAILKVTDAILIDRGDLARELPLQSLPFVQKEIIAQANAAGVPVYVATNLLESMVSSARPSRAEVNDVINTLMDGADGLVLAAETAIGRFPVQCVSMIQSLVHQFEIRRNPSLGKQSSAASSLPSTSGLVTPNGGRLIQRISPDIDSRTIAELPTLEVDELVMMDARQIAVGAFSPLEGFMGREELESVLSKNRLPDGSVWPMPVVLQVSNDNARSGWKGETIALTHDGRPGALLHVEECFTHDCQTLAERWFGTSDAGHPGAARIILGGNTFLAGKVDILPEVLASRQPYDLVPSQARLIFDHLSWQRIVGFHTRNVAHRAHEYLQFTALTDHHCDGLFVHPVVGPKKSGDFSGDIILKTYQLLIQNHYPPNKAVLGAFMTYSRYAGPREAVFTAVCRQNFGCSHFIMGRDHTGLGNYYPPDASQRLFEDLGDLAIQPVLFGG